MPTPYDFKIFGLTDPAVHTYLTLLRHQPINGSQLSKHADIPRARIYDILRALKNRGFVSETTKGRFVALPSDELIRQLRREHEEELARFDRLASSIAVSEEEDFIWTVTGYPQAMDKAREMIQAASQEIYIRLFPAEADHLITSLHTAQKRKVAVKCIFMQPYAARLAMQVTHPDHEKVEDQLGGRSFDLVVDKTEFIGGLFPPGPEAEARLNWGRNRWFVVSGRDSLRHDFFHCFLYKTQTLKQPLTDAEKRLYTLIQNDG